MPCPSAWVRLAGPLPTAPRNGPSRSRQRGLPPRPCSRTESILSGQQESQTKAAQGSSQGPPTLSFMSFAKWRGREGDGRVWDTGLQGTAATCKVRERKEGRDPYIWAKKDSTLPSVGLLGRQLSPHGLRLRFCELVIVTTVMLTPADADALLKPGFGTACASSQHQRNKGQYGPMMPGR